MLVLLIAGCGEASDGVWVEGRVTFRGEPLPRGAITFFPTAGRPSTAPLSEEGEYAIALPPGEYDVVMNISAEIPPGYKEGDPLPPPKVVLPPQYTTRARSTLDATVSEDSDAPINFELK